MANLNQVTIIGNVGNNEVKDYKWGSVLRLSVATNKSWKDKNDEWKQKTTWHNVEKMDKKSSIIQNLSEKLKKGTPCLVEGSYESDEYESNGEKKKVFKIKARRIQSLVSNKKKEEDCF